MSSSTIISTTLVPQTTNIGGNGDGLEPQKKSKKSKKNTKLTKEERDRQYIESYDEVNHLNDWGFQGTACDYCFIKNSELSGLLMQCGRCKKAYFCSTECFNNGLSVHNQFCLTDGWDRNPIGTKVTMPPLISRSNEATYIPSLPTKEDEYEQPPSSPTKKKTITQSKIQSNHMTPSEDTQNSKDSHPTPVAVDEKQIDTNSIEVHSDVLIQQPKRYDYGKGKSNPTNHIPTSSPKKAPQKKDSTKKGSIPETILTTTIIHHNPTTQVDEKKTSNKLEKAPSPPPKTTTIMSTTHCPLYADDSDNESSSEKETNDNKISTSTNKTKRNKNDENHKTKNDKKQIVNNTITTKEPFKQENNRPNTMNDNDPKDYNDSDAIHEVQDGSESSATVGTNNDNDDDDDDDEKMDQITETVRLARQKPKIGDDDGISKTSCSSSHEDETEEDENENENEDDDDDDDDDSDEEYEETFVTVTTTSVTSEMEEQQRQKQQMMKPTNKFHMNRTRIDGIPEEDDDDDNNTNQNGSFDRDHLHSGSKQYIYYDEDDVLIDNKTDDTQQSPYAIWPTGKQLPVIVPIPAPGIELRPTIRDENESQYGWEAPDWVSHPKLLNPIVPSTTNNDNNNHTPDGMNGDGSGSGIGIGIGDCVDETKGDHSMDPNSEYYPESRKVSRLRPAGFVPSVDENANKNRFLLSYNSDQKENHQINSTNTMTTNDHDGHNGKNCVSDNEEFDDVDELNGSGADDESKRQVGLLHPSRVLKYQGEDNNNNATTHRKVRMGSHSILPLDNNVISEQEKIRLRRIEQDMLTKKDFPWEKPEWTTLAGNLSSTTTTMKMEDSKQQRNNRTMEGGGCNGLISSDSFGFLDLYMEDDAGEKDKMNIDEENGNASMKNNNSWNNSSMRLRPTEPERKQYSWDKPEWVKKKQFQKQGHGMAESYAGLDFYEEYNGSTTNMDYHRSFSTLGGTGCTGSTTSMSSSEWIQQKKEELKRAAIMNQNKRYEWMKPDWAKSPALKRTTKGIKLKQQGTLQNGTNSPSKLLQSGKVKWDKPVWVTSSPLRKKKVIPPSSANRNLLNANLEGKGPGHKWIVQSISSSANKTMDENDMNGLGGGGSGEEPVNSLFSIPNL